MNEEIRRIANWGKTPEKDWKNDNSDFNQALCNVYKKLRQFFFHIYSLTFNPLVRDVH